MLPDRSDEELQKMHAEMFRSVKSLYIEGLKAFAPILLSIMFLLLVVSGVVAYFIHLALAQ